ncbi:MAG: NirD/YgiW/YdeI family stress tolerance protein [Deferribacteraceae bacterium]|jgi:uncharacterized protein (TIGR00156 family)|nr:NirD/YgiW/YdeI family stress tolerance protein [Deferribacteraceae bacterium]
MKKVFVLTMCLVFSAVAMAQYTGSSRTATASTVREALELPDDAHVTLTGKLSERIKGDHYTFTDSTGSIEVEIDNKHWRNLQVGPNDTVVISGEIDKDFSKRKVDVDRIEKR